MPIINGTAGADTLLGAYDTSPETILGGGGDDLIQITRRIPLGSGLYDGGEGNDIIALPVADISDLSVFGGDGDDVIAASPDTNPAGPLPPLYVPFADGGPGTDTLVVQFRDAGRPATIDLAGGRAFVDSLELFRLVNVENAFLTRVARLDPNASVPSGVATITGSADGNVIVSEPAALVYALGGADAVYGGAGADVLLGGAGDDTLLGRGNDDALFGQDGADRLDGGAGSDILSGGAGNDNLLGGGGADQYLYDFREGSGSFGVDGIFGFNRDEGDRIVLLGAPDAVRLVGGSGPAIFAAGSDSYLFLGRSAGGQESWAIVVGVPDLAARDLLLVTP